MTIRWVAHAVPRLTTQSAAKEWYQQIWSTVRVSLGWSMNHRVFAGPLTLFIEPSPDPRVPDKATLFIRVHLGLPQRRSHLPPAIMFPAASRLKRDRCEDDLWNSLLVNPQPCKIHREDKSWPTAAHFRPRQNRKDVYLTCCFGICSIFCSKIRMRTACGSARCDFFAEILAFFTFLLIKRPNCHAKMPPSPSQCQ